VSTLNRRLSGIWQAHQAAGYQTRTKDAEVRLVFQGIRRTVGSAPNQKYPSRRLRCAPDTRACIEGPHQHQPH